MRLELSPAVTDNGSGAVHQTADHAGFTKDGLYSWFYKDSVLEIVYAKTNELFADWRFGKALKDRNTIISCVSEFDCSEGHMLLVATESLSDEGTLCLFSFSKKKVVRAVEFPRKIRAVEIVFTNTKEDVPTWILSKHLHFFCGLAAVGTEGGFTYLVDLRLDDVMLNSTNEIQVKKLAVYSPGLIDPKTKRDNVCSNDKHMAVLIDNQCHRNEQFYYRRQDDSIDKVFEEDAVCVTSLKYLNQAGILAVGFNFGCFQMWRLHTPVLDYSTRFTPESYAVSSFVVQEPENDPRNLVYLWVGRDESVLGEEHGHGKLSTISLYQLCFNKKEMYADFGLFYEDLESVCGRLDHKLHVNPYLGGYNKTTWSSKLICAYTITNPVYTPPVALANDSFDEGSHGNDLSLSVFVWRADSKQSGHTTSYWMAIFDLNRWYHAQMPHSIRCHGSALQVCPYWAVYKLDDIVALSYPQSLLQVQLTGNNVLKFSCKSPMPPEEHSFPSALEITDVRFVTPQKTVKGHCYGWQSNLLQELVRDGAMHLVTPDSFYHQCLQARLIPQNYSDSGTVDHQRKSLLNLSLDYSLTVCLIHKCIHAWMDGEFVDAGCTLALLLDWAWQAVARIKDKLDTACQILYDCSGRTLDPYTDWLIRRHFCSLSSLKQVFTIFLSQPDTITVRGHGELEMRLEVLRLLVAHHTMVQWCLIEGLLPETREGSTQLPSLFAYPYSDLCRATKKRRVEFKALNGGVTNHSLLLIDGLIKCAGPQIATIWQSEGENDLYPPTSMQALMSLFLLEDVLLEVKQAIMLYFLQDLAAVISCDDQDRQNVVVSFVRSFGILPSLVHTVHGLWCIDHRDYEEGLRQLVNPNVQPHVWTSWMDVSVINTLLAQGQEAVAARYMCSGHSLGATLEEQKLNIAVLVRNRKVSAAVDYMRQRCYHKKDPSDLMPFMLKECQNNKMIGQLLQLHLLQVEEMEVEKYLRDRSEPQALEPLLLYYLTHSRFVEAFTLNEEMNKLDKLEATCPAAREKAANRNRLMEAYLRVLPDITRKVLMEKQHRPNGTMGKRVEVLKPKPLSTMVFKKESHVMSRSQLIMAVMDKVEEAMNVVEDLEQEGGGGELMGAGDSEDKNRSVYVATPLTPRHKSFVRLALTPDEMMGDPEEVPPSSLPTNPLSAAKRKLGGMWDVGEDMEGNSLSALTKECLDLLRTPLKGLRGEVSPRATLAVSAIAVKTPQSILKVRRLSKTLVRSEYRKTPDTGRRPKKQLGFSASDSAIDSPSSPSLEMKSLPAATPKQLRFVGLSPSPSPSPLPVRGKESPFGTDTSQSFISEDESQEITAPDSEADERMDVEKEEVAEDKHEEVAEDKHEEVAEDKHEEVAEEKVEETEEDVQKEDVGVDNVGADTESENVVEEVLVEEVHLAEDEECMETNQLQKEDFEQEVTSSGVTADQTVVVESLEVTSETVAKPFDEGSADRYDEDLDKLVRPNLQSPWKHNLSSEEVVTVEQDNVTLHLTHVEGEVMTPTMTSSPLEEMPEKQSDKPGTTLPVKCVVEMKEDQGVKSAIDNDGEGDVSTKELQRNILQSLIAPRRSEMTSTFPSIDRHSRIGLSDVSGLSVDISSTTIVQTSFTSKGESSPEKVATKEDSPPATPPLSKRAKMIVKGTRKSKFNLVTPRRELRSTRSSDRQVKANVSMETKMETIEDVAMNQDVENNESRVEKSSERKSVVRSSKRKAGGEEGGQEDVGQDGSLSVGATARLRRTPVRRSPSRNVRKKADEGEEHMKTEDENKDEDKDKISEQENKNDDGDVVTGNVISHGSHSRSAGEKTDEGDKKTNTDAANKDGGKVNEDDKNDDDEIAENVISQSRLRQTSVRRSPARSVKRKAAGGGGDDGSDQGEASGEQEMSMRTRLRSKTPDRKSPSRSTRKKVLNEIEFEKIKESDEMTMETESGLPVKSLKETSVEKESESGSHEENKRVRQRKTPERMSPSRSVRGRKTETDLSNENVEINKSALETRVSSRLRSSPARNASRSKTPERQTPARKSKAQEKQIIEEVVDVNDDVPHLEPETGIGEKENKDEEFTSGEEFIEKLDEEEEMAPPPSPSRRRSSRLNTPERGTHSSHTVEPSRRASRGRTTSISVTGPATDTDQPELAPGQEVADDARRARRSQTPERGNEEDEHNLRRSRRLSRTPERFRTEAGESAIATPPKGQRSSPTRNTTPQRARRSPGRSTKSKEETEEEVDLDSELPMPKRNLTDALVDADEGIKDSGGDVKSEGVWSEELPPLRLEEAEEEVVDLEKGDESQPTIVFKELFPPVHVIQGTQKVTQASESVSSTVSSTFVFSDPMSHTDNQVEVKGHGNDDDDVPSHDFVFSHPTVAEDQDGQEHGREKQKTSKLEKTEKKTTTKFSKRQRKTLLDSPDLLPLTDASGTEQPKKERSRVRMSEIQRASASVVRRYRTRSGPLTRRLVPSSHKSDSDQQE